MKITPKILQNIAKDTLRNITTYASNEALPTSPHRFMYGQYKLALKFDPTAIGLTIGNPNPGEFTISPKLQRLIDSILRGEENDYTSMAGDEDRRQKLAEYFNRKKFTNYDYKNFILAGGATNAIDLIFDNMSGPFILPTPVYDPYISKLVDSKKQTVLFDNSAEGFVVEGKQGGNLDKAVEMAFGKAQATNPNLTKEEFIFNFVFTDAGNPSSFKHNEEQLKSICDLFSNKWKSGNVVSDAIYADLAYDAKDRKTILDFAVGSEFENRIIEVDSVSKVGSGPNIRLGYAASGDVAFLEKLAAKNLTKTIAPSLISQLIGVERITQRDEYADFQAQEYQKKSEIFTAGLRQKDLIDYRPNASFYSLIKTDFLSKVELASNEIKFAQEFYGEKKCHDLLGQNNGLVGRDPLFAATIFAKRAGLFLIPVTRDYGDSSHVQYSQFNENGSAYLRAVTATDTETLKKANGKILGLYEEVVKKYGAKILPPSSLASSANASKFAVKEENFRN
jgi:aspartate/methionine/tyrosine aminotransferase